MTAANTHHRRPWRRRSATASLAIVLLGVGAAVPALGQTEEPQDHWLTLAELGLEPPSAQQAQEAITVYEIGAPIVYSAEGRIEVLETVEEDAGETVISLSSDILFTPDSWELPASVDKKIADLLADVPEGSDLAVHGHTDSVQGAVDNQELSEKRAAAVADVVKKVRGDLTLDVQGFANTRPKKPEINDADRQANRRVELRYG